MPPACDTRLGRTPLAPPVAGEAPCRGRRKKMFWDFYALKYAGENRSNLQFPFFSPVAHPNLVFACGAKNSATKNTRRNKRAAHVNMPHAWPTPSTTNTVTVIP